MNLTKQQRFEMADQALKCAKQFVRDAGYEYLYPIKGGDRGGASVYEYEFCFEARKGPRATRKSPIEQLVVRVRFTGPNHKTLRPSFVTKTAE